MVILLLLALALPPTGGGVVMAWAPIRTNPAALPPLDARELELSDRLAFHVGRLAGSIGERHLWRYDALQAAAEYITEQWRRLGYRVNDRPYEVGGRVVRNLEVNLPGSARAEEIVVVGGHYDSVPGCPGANDNATGVAAVIEISRLLRGGPPVGAAAPVPASSAAAGDPAAAVSFDRTIRFVAFVNEEPPFFRTDSMGSLVYARKCRARADSVVAMFSIETIGYYSDAEESQQYPFPLGFFYPHRADFIAFVSNLRSRPLLRRSAAAFRAHTTFPLQCGALPGAIEGVGWSDHWSFWQAGYPAIMVTDTALYRFPGYHGADDTPDKIDYHRMARVVAGLAGVVGEIASE
jgi:hypothetical protein